MKKYSQSSILGMAFIMLLILMTACSIGGSPTTQQTATPTPKPKTPLAILKESQAKMDALQSVAVDGTVASKTSSASSGDTDVQMNLSGETSKSPQSLSLQMDGTVTTSGLSIPLSLAMIGVDQKVYIQNTKKQGPWYIMSDAQGKDFFGSVGGLGSNTKSNLLDVATDADVTDHSIETVNGKQLRHLTITVTDNKKDLKKAFLESTGGFKDLTSAQVDSIKLQSGTMDYWIDETTLYVYQQADQYKAQYHVDASSTITPGSANLTKEQSMKLTYSKFNAPVTIQAPANAQPLKSILDVLM